MCKYLILMEELEFCVYKGWVREESPYRTGKASQGNLRWWQEVPIGGGQCRNFKNTGQGELIASRGQGSWLGIIVSGGKIGLGSSVGSSDQMPSSWQAIKASTRFHKFWSLCGSFRKMLYSSSISWKIFFASLLLWGEVIKTLFIAGLVLFDFIS